METKRIQILDPQKVKDEELAEAAGILRKGGLVAFPTETVYGLGANGLDEEAAKKIYAAKGRPSSYCTYFSAGRIGGPGGRDSLLCKKADGAVLARPSDHGF